MPAKGSKRGTPPGYQKGRACRRITSRSLVVVDLEVLDLDHHREQVADVEAGDGERAVVLGRLVDDVDAVVLLLVRPGPGQHVVELLDAVDLHPEVVHAGPGHVRV